MIQQKKELVRLKLVLGLLLLSKKKNDEKAELWSTSWKTLNYLVNRQDMFNIIMLLVLGLKYYEKKCKLTQILSKYSGATKS